jgi:hypothetical protein
MATGVLHTGRPVSLDCAPQPARGNRIWIPLLLAAVFGLWSLRSVPGGNVIDTDAARHAMNGAFVHDLVKSGRLAHPIEYGKEYYGRLPALSMPYHPPGFPGIESLFYFVFGVNLLAARLAVAAAVAASVLLMYGLVRATHASDLLAACVTVTMFSLWGSQLVATDVMLEFPSLALALAALCCLPHRGREYPFGRALLFAVLAAAAVWTKQFAVFVGAVPPLYFLATGRWRLLFGKSLWISSALFGLAVIALTRLSTPFHHTGVSQIPTDALDLKDVIIHNFQYYLEAAFRGLLGVPGVFALAVLVCLVWVVRRGEWRGWKVNLYLAWIAAMLPVLLVVGSYSHRYFFYIIPPFLVVGYALLLRVAPAFAGPERAWRIPAGFAAAFVIAGLFFQPESLSGPAQAAAMVVNGSPGRILYAGDADGTFIFEARARDPKLQTTIIPAQKLDDAVFSPPAFEEFCRKYGIGWIVMEQTAAAQKWSALPGAPAPSMKLERTLPLTSSRPRWRGKILIYRFLSPSPTPASGLALPVEKILDKIEVRN